MANKTRPGFINFLAIVSILGFLSVSTLTFIKLDISQYVEALIFMIMGAGLLIEGNIRGIAKYVKNGLTSNEISHIVAIVIGIASIIVGALTLPNLNIDTTSLESVKGLVSVVAIIIIAIETWIIK